MSDLNYHIVYRPNGNAANSEKNVSIKGDIYDSDKKNNDELNKDDFVFIYDDNKKPVIVLLGWAGCQDKYLAKYSAIYEEKRFVYYLIINYLCNICIFPHYCENFPLYRKELFEVKITRKYKI